MEIEYKVPCPKCLAKSVKRATSFGGFNVYRRLVCSECGFEGGRVVDYEGEEDRVERELVERFQVNSRDAVKEFVDTIVGR